MTGLLSLLSTVLLSQPASGSPAPLPLLSLAAQAGPLDGALRTTLDNGLRILCVETPGTGTVAIAALANTSARAESAPLAGIRYFAARALVECSLADRPALTDRLQDLGADAFAGATLDLSQVTVHAAAEDVGPAAQLLRDIVFEAQFEESSIARLRRQFATGLAASGQLPEVAADLAAAARLYPNHPFGWSVEGSATTVPTFTSEQVQRVHAGSFVPNNMVVVAAGGVPAAQSLEAIRAAFGGLLPGARLPEAADSPHAPLAGVEQLVRPSGTAVVHLGARAPGLADPAYPSAAVALAILGAGMGSRLYDALRREDGVAYTFAAEAVAAREGARASVVAACPPERVDDVEGRMLLAMRNLMTDLASPEEILRAKEYILTSYALTHQRSADLAHQLGALEIASGRGLELDRELPRLVRQTTAEQVREAARAMFEARVRVRVLPS